MTMWQATSGNKIYPSQTGLEVDSARVATTGDSAHPHQDDACKVLKEYFDDLEVSLFDIDKNVSISRLQTIWIEISQFIQTEKNHIFDDGYNRLLNRLTAIYTRGVEQDRNLAFAATATNYADLIEIVSQAHPTYDYSEAIGHLLHYMNQLYKDREKSWLTIFDHLLSMPEYIKPIYYLKQRHLKEIQQWVDEGVDNLFQIRDDQTLLHSEKIAELAEMEQTIELLSQRLGKTRHGKVVPITLLNDQASLQRLIIKRDNLIFDLENRQELIELLENNLQEFEDKIFATRRACAIRSI